MNEMMLETKAYGLEPRQALDDLQSAFAAYRDANDTRLAELETRGSADVVTLDKLNRLDAALDKTQYAGMGQLLVPDAPALLFAAAASLLLALLAGLVPALNLARRPVAELLREAA